MALACHGDDRLRAHPLSYPLGIDCQALFEHATAHGACAPHTDEVTGSGRCKEVFFKLAIDSEGSKDPRTRPSDAHLMGCATAS